MGDAEKNHVYVVTVIEPFMEPYTETFVFNNEDAAREAWQHYVNISHNVLTNYCSIYNEFKVTK